MNKLLLLSFLLTLLAFYSNAQIRKGSLYLGSSLNFNSKEQESSNTSSEIKAFYISPAIGIAVKENLIAGILINYGHQKTEQLNGSNGNTIKYENIGGGFFARRYFSVANKFFLFGQGDAMYNKHEFEQKFTIGGGTPFISTEGWNAQLNFTPGLSYNLFRSLHLETSFGNFLGLSYQKETRTETGFGSPLLTESKGFSLQSSLSNSNFLNVGLRFIIPKKK
jgi:hypothetical protein